MKQSKNIIMSLDAINKMASKYMKKNWELQSGFDS